MTIPDVQCGTRIRVTQRIERRGGNWETQVEGRVVSIGPKPTGSWYAHGKDDRYWLLRIDLEKDDGELSRISLDQNTRIDVLDS